MGKPYRLQGEGQTTERSSAVAQANVGRGGDGKFTKLESPTAHAVKVEAREGEKSLEEAQRTARVPEKAVGSDKPTMSGADAVYEDSLPWPEAGPYNDADHMPMKLKG